MATVTECPSCGKPITEAGAELCPHCGGRLDGQEWISYRAPRGRAYRTIAVLILVTVGLSILVILLLTIFSQWEQLHKP